MIQIKYNLDISLFILLFLLIFYKTFAFNKFDIILFIIHYKYVYNNILFNFLYKNLVIFYNLFYYE